MRANLVRDTAQQGLTFEKHLQYTALRNELDHFQSMYDKHMQKEDIKTLEGKYKAAKDEIMANK